MYEQSHRDYLRSGYLHHRLPVAPPIITAYYLQPSATKMPENWSLWTRQLPTCRCVSVLFALDAKYTKELADAKAENDALRDDVVSTSSVAHQSSLSVRKPPSPPAWIMQPPPDWQTPLNGIISPWEEADHWCKNKPTQKYINEIV